MRYVPLYIAGLLVAGLSMVVGGALAGAVLEILPAYLDVTANVVAVALLVGVPLFAVTLVGRAAPASETRPPAAAGAAPAGTRAHLARSWPFYGVAVGTGVWIGRNVGDGSFWVLGPYMLVPCLAALGLVLGDLWWSRTTRRLAGRRIAAADGQAA